MTVKRQWTIGILSCILLSGVVSCRSGKKKTIFESLPASQTQIGFTNKLPEREMLNILYYLYFYNGGGVATGDINNDGLPDVYFTANSHGGNKLYLNKGNFQFEDITAKAGVAGSADWCSGVTMADVNADGYLDIYVMASSGHHGLKGRNELFLNNKNNTFTEGAVSLGLGFSGFGTQSAFFDYDQDGDLDCYLLNHSQKPNSNIMDTLFRRKTDSLSGDRLLRNDLATVGKFTDVTAAAGIYSSSLGYGLGISVADFNNDGWDDIYVGNDFHENDYYYINRGNGTFREEGAAHFGHYSRFSMGNDAADYNNDGQMDIVTVDMLPPDEKVLKTYGSDENPDTYMYKLMGHGYQNQYSKNCLQRNNGSGNNFSETGLQSGISATDWSWAPLFADFDNDGNKDLFISSGIVKRPVDLDYVRFVSDLVLKKGDNKTSELDNEAISNMPDGSSHPYFFQGDGKMKFSDQSKSWGTGSMKGYFTGASYADLDNDGNLDLVVNCINAPALVLKNNSPSRYTVDISFKGSDANTFGIGAKAWLFSDGQMQYQQLMTTRGFQSSCDPKLHFGVDSVKYIDSILVVWPDQKFQLIRNVPAKGLIEVKQTESGGQFAYASFFPPKQQLLTETQVIGWKHRENEFLDYNKQYLIPHQLSTRGPQMAVADVNGDGLDDIYMCGASGQSGQLLIQAANGNFQPGDSTAFSALAACEEVDAAFFDGNNDGFPDLYVVSGGNELADGNPSLADHYYLNDGKGHFKSADAQIPQINKNKSCISVSDVDKDGDLDLFIGGLADAKRYGIPQRSYLLFNDGKGNFTKTPESVIRLDSLGMVTSAVFTDINKDGWEDLVVTGEWMPIKLFMNNKGVFSETDVPGSTGLWQSLYAADVNGDGYADLLGGNWGHNSKLYAGKEGPLKLYVKDFDNNGSVEQVMCYTLDGKEYTFLAKDELERPLPVLKKAYLHYSDVAGKTVQYMFYDLFTNYMEWKAEVLGSSVFLNDGKGQFTRQDLPNELQLAPVFSFCKGPASRPAAWMAGGNFSGVVPYEGRYDALPLTLFSYRNTDATFAFDGSLAPPFREIRDMKWLRAPEGRQVLVLASNNDNPRVYKPVQ